MFWNYFVTAWRNIFRNKFYSALHVCGLAISLAVGILVLLWVKDELSFDRFHPHADHIYRMISHIGTGNTQQVWSNSPSPLAVFARKDVPGVVNAVRIAQNYDYSLFKYGKNRFTADHSAYVDRGFFTMFHFPLVEGNPANPFPDAHSLILSQTAARKYFGHADPLGKVLVADNSTSFTVSGIMADFPKNSSLQYEMLFPMALYAQNFRGNGSWKTIDEDLGNFFYDVYIQLKPGVSPDAVGRQLSRIYQTKKGEDINSEFFTTQPLMHMHLYQPDGSNSGMQLVRIFLLVGIMILVIGCINYVNLSTARSLVRSREVSMRKIIGAARTNLFLQFITETALLFLFSTLLATVLVALLIPAYNQISGKQLGFSLLDPSNWTAIGVALAGTLAASSIYPALLLSSFKPIEALRGRISAGIGNRSFRKLLVVTQFVISVFLIASTLVIGHQLNYIRSRSLGFDRSYVFTVAMQGIQSHYGAVKDQLLSQPGILGVASADDNIVSMDNSTGDTQWDGKEPGRLFVIHPMGIDERFIPLMKIQMAAGSNFTGSKADSAHYILNETAVKEAGIKNPIGKTFTLWEIPGTIIGVVKDFNYASLRDKIEPQIFRYDPQPYALYIRTEGKDAPKAISAVRTIWKQYNADFPFEYHFLDESFDQLYRSDERMGVLFNIFALVAIFISCLGLFGLATYTAQVKTREIGIRKVIGATVWNLVTYLSGDFIKLVLLSIIIAVPITLYFTARWLDNFAYRIHPGPGIFLMAGSLVVLIAVITVSFQALKAAIANPIKALRSE